MGCTDDRHRAPLHGDARCDPPCRAPTRRAHRRGAARVPRSRRSRAPRPARRRRDGRAVAMTVHLRDVTLRDGLQDERPITTDDKLAVFEALVRAGVRDLELTSFVRPDRVPAMADAPELAAATARTGVERW